MVFGRIVRSQYLGGIIVGQETTTKRPNRVLLMRLSFYSVTELGWSEKGAAVEGGGRRL
jgi:hypothetical protein